MDVPHRNRELADIERLSRMLRRRRPTDYRYYGQHGEDYLLWHLFDFRPTGFFLDVGAHDGVALSNTKSFEEAGWTGICVEPIPEMFEACRRVRRRVVRAACVAGTRETVELRVDRSGLYAGIEADEAQALHGYQERRLGDPCFRTIRVPAMRAAALLSADDPPIDFASIDVEGTEIDVLEGLDLTRNRPRVLVVEALTDDARAALDRYMARFGYRRARSVAGNQFYVATARDARKLRGITIDCKLIIPEIDGYGPAEVADRAWSAPATTTRMGFVAGKLRQRYRRWMWRV
jgi:FkbM family methyltransferase